MLKSFFYFFYNFYSKVLKESDPVFTTKLVHGFIQSLIVYAPLQFISLFIFNYVLSKWIGLAIILLSIALNFKVYNSSLVRKVINEKPTLVNNRLISNILVVSISIFLFVSVLVSASIYGG